jgi:hypothetical protein
MLETWVDCRRTSRRQVCTISLEYVHCVNIAQTCLSKIMTAGVIRVAEPAATATSAAKSSAIRLLVCWMLNGSAWSIFCVMMCVEYCLFKQAMLPSFGRDDLAVYSSLYRDKKGEPKVIERTVIVKINKATRGRLYETTYCGSTG